MIRCSRFTFSGWGGEDDDFSQNRIANHQIVRFEQHIARYTMLPHHKATPNPTRFEQLTSSKHQFKNKSEGYRTNRISDNKNIVTADGLMDIQYDVLKITKKTLYTHIIVDL